VVPFSERLKRSEERQTFKTVMAVPSLMYASEMCALTKQNPRSIELVEMRSIIPFKGRPRIDKILNVDIRSESGIYKLNEKMHTNK
jgi:hypothetical protein